MKKLINFLIAVTILTVLLLSLGSYLRSTKFQDTVELSAIPSLYECGGEHCVGFTIKQAYPDSLSSFNGTFVLPYSRTLNSDDLQNKLAHLIDNTGNGQPVCVTGFLHKFSVGTLRLFPHSNSDNHRIELLEFNEGLCTKKSS